MFKYFATLTLLLVSVYCISQQVAATGKVTYTLSNQPKNFIEMHFTHDAYTYTYKDVFADTAINKAENNLHDDDKTEANRKKRMAELRKQLPTQHWYGRIGSNVITYSTFDNQNRQYCIRDTTMFVEWKLENQQDSISGLMCQKATGIYNGKQYAAWFAPSIPVSVAPLQFRGLPGLLIKATNLSNNITIQLRSLDWPFKGLPVDAGCETGSFLSKAAFQALEAKEKEGYQNTLDIFQRQKQTQQQ